MVELKLKRAYDAPSTDDGYRVLVDRLWPRGERKDEFEYDDWEKKLAPSTELREWFHEDPENRWSDFVIKYKSELRNNPLVTDFVHYIMSKKKVTLLYSSKDTERNNAVILKEYIESII